MNNKSLSNLGLGLLLIILSMGGLSAYSYINSTNNNEKTAKEIFHQEDYFKLHDGMYQSVVERSKILFQLIYTTNTEDLDKLKVKAVKKKQKLMDLLEQSHHYHSLATHEIITQQEQYIAEYHQLEESYISLVEKNPSQGHIFFDTRVLPQRSMILKHIQGSIDHIRSTTTKLREQHFQQHKLSIETNLMINLLVIFLNGIMFYFLFKSHNGNNKKIYHQARTDSLTGLSNREEFLNTSEEYLSQNLDSKSIVIFLDIDFFKSINDTYGHKLGDIVLVNFAKKLTSLITKDCILARLGGDEFALLIKNTEEKDVRKFVTDITSSLQFSLEEEYSDIAISSTIGVSQYPQDGKYIDTLLKHADEAMYFAKESGRGTFKFYSDEIRAVQRSNDESTQKLRSILTRNNPNNNLYLEYQPLLSCDNNPDEIKECEALLRWKDDDGNNISPEKFIALSEKTNLINDINKFVIDEVCKQQKNWQKDSQVEDIRVNINLSGGKKIFKELLDRLKDNIKKYDLNPRLFGIEITERTLVDVSDSTIAELEAIRNMGMKISIDDFGTGYSSFGYLNKLPITTLKIDKEFIDDLPENKYNQKIVDSIIGLGHSLGLEIVAEGVETQEQLSYLKDKSCNSIQGYLFNKPLSISAIYSYLNQGTALAI